MTTDTHPSRREANRVATHTGIVDAAFALVTEQENGPDTLTVDAIAERAQVSRRTFFNYFPSLEAALTQPVSELLATAMCAYRERPADEPPLAAVQAAFTAAFTPERLPRLSQQFAVCSRNAAARRHHLEQWDHAQDEILAAIAARLPHVDPILAQTVAGAALGVLERIVSRWLAACLEHGTAPADHLPALHNDVRRALTYLAEGLQDHLQPPA